MFLLSKNNKINITNDYDIIDLIILLIVSSIIFFLSMLGIFNPLYETSINLFGNYIGEMYREINKIQDNIDYIMNLSSIREENELLKSRNLQLQSEILKAKITIEELLLLEKQIASNLNYNYFQARVINYSDNEFGEIIINKGEINGIKLGNIVVIDQFAIGEIIQVNDKFSVVRLIISPKSVIPVISSESKVKGILRGDAKIGKKMTEVLVNEKLIFNELVVTSGINSNYPYGLIIGNIISDDFVRTGLTKELVIINEIDYMNLDIVYIINESI
jgi:rod shape-determining protein MreC